MPREIEFLRLTDNTRQGRPQAVLGERTHRPGRYFSGAATVPILLALWTCTSTIPPAILARCNFLLSVITHLPK